MYLIEKNGSIKGYSSRKPHAGKYYEVEEDNEFYTFLKDYHPYRSVKVSDKGVMYFHDNEEKKNVYNYGQNKLNKGMQIGDLTVTTSSGNVYNADSVSQSRIANKITALGLLGERKTSWKLYNNNTKEVTVDELKEAFLLIDDKISEILLG